VCACSLEVTCLCAKAAKHALDLYASRPRSRDTRTRASLTPLLRVALACPQFFLAGSICACLSHVGGVPIDVLKTRLQTDPGRYDGLWDAAVKVTRTEGPGMLLQGLGPTATGYAVQGAAPGARVLGSRWDTRSRALLAVLW
jgi:Mitochondrial carrier protein